MKLLVYLLLLAEWISLTIHYGTKLTQYYHIGMWTIEPLKYIAVESWMLFSGAVSTWIIQIILKEVPKYSLKKEAED